MSALGRQSFGIQLEDPRKGLRSYRQSADGKDKGKQTKAVE